MEIIPKQKSFFSINQNTLRYLGGAVLAIILGAFVVLLVLYNLKIDEAEQLQEEIAQSASQKQVELSEQFARYAEKARDYMNLVGARQDPLAVFEFLEEHTHQQVSFSSSSLNLEEGILQLEGRANSFVTLEEQLLIFQEVEGLAGVELSDDFAFDTTEGTVRFSVTLTFSPEMLAYE